MVLFPLLENKSGIEPAEAKKADPQAEEGEDTKQPCELRSIIKKDFANGEDNEG